jgi:hypothetical protein
MHSPPSHRIYGVHAATTDSMVVPTIFTFWIREVKTRNWNRLTFDFPENFHQFHKSS